MIPGRLLLLLPPAPAPPRVPTLVRAGPEAVVHRFESGSSARYFSVVRVEARKLADARDVRSPGAPPTTPAATSTRVSFWRDRDESAGPKSSLAACKKSKSDERPEPARDELGTQHGAAWTRARCTRRRSR